jgi:hypothetical protein
VTTREIVVLSKNSKSERLWTALPPNQFTYLSLSDVIPSISDRVVNRFWRFISKDPSLAIESSIAKAIVCRLPKDVCLVTLDNSITLVAAIAKLRPEIPILLIQHGCNYFSYNQTIRTNIENSILLSWGQREVENYSLRGIRPRLIHPIGSLLSSMTKVQNRLNLQGRARICVVSEFRADSDLETEGYMLARQRAWTQLLSWLGRAQQELNFDVVVALRPSTFGSGNTSKNQKRYFTQALGVQPIFSDEQGFDNSYGAVDSSTVVLGLQSGLLFEALSRGKKVLFCFPKDSDASLHPPLEGLARLELSSFSEFTNRISQAIQLSSSEFLKSLKPETDYFVHSLGDPNDAIRHFVTNLRVGKSIDECFPSQND